MVAIACPDGVIKIYDYEKQEWQKTDTNCIYLDNVSKEIKE